ncbi:MAG TPA: choice-of-anchor D domain-containing protein [Trebonia sp.]
MFHPAPPSRPPKLHGLRRLLLAGATSIALATAGLAGVAVLAATPAFAATATGGQGASLPYTEVLAQNSATTGTVIGPSYTQGQLADEAVGRKAVTLAGSGSGQSVTFTTPVTTNSIDFRYSIPDSSGGSVYTAPLSLYINGVKQTDFTLTNAYSWYYGSYPFVNTPGSGTPMHFFDEVHRLFSTTYPAGTTFKLEVDSEDTASSYTINLADFENVAAPLAQPGGSVSVVSEGADPTGVNDSTNAFNAAITAAGSGGTVWIPAGTYNIPGHIIVNNVTVEGAGMWYSTVTGTAPGFYGNSAPNASTNVHLSNFAIFGNVQIRDDSAQVNGIGGALSNSTVSNIWIEHMKVGAWMDGPMTNLTFSGMRIRDTTADGINLHGGVTSSTITNSSIRNTGDDGIALWADAGVGADSGDMISNNTLQQQQLANGIAVYGGNNNTVTGNLVEDTGINQGGGITAAQRFDSTPLGLTTISNNTMIRDGQLDPNWQFGVGALWFDGEQGSVTGPVNVTNALIEQSPFEAIQWVEGTVSGVNLNNVSIIGTGTFALQEQTGGAATFTNVTATGVAQANLGNDPSYNCEGTGFAITDDGGNSGISPAGCSVGDSPTPVYPPYPVTGVNASPTALTFSPQVTGTTSAAQTVTVANPTSAAAPVSSIAASGPFAETNNCGSSIAANSSCTVNVTFSPTASGASTGSVTINAGGVTSTVSLSGTGTAPGPVLSASPASLSFPSTLVGSSPATQTVTVTNTGTTAATVSSVAVTGAFSQTNNCTTIAVNGTCTVTVKFTPTAATNTGTLTVNSNANDNPLTVGLSGAGITSTTNIALNKPVTASSDYQSYVPANVTDGNTSTYWESADGAAYPQTITVDLGSTQSIGSVTLDLPPATAWATRTETLSVLGSTNGTTFSQLVGSAGYTFNPSTGNTATISLPSGTSDRYVELSFTGNTGWTAAQLSEFEVFPGGGGGSTGGSSALTASPTSESFGNENVGSTSAARSVTISNSGSAAASMSSIGVTGPFGESNNCGTSLAAGATCTVGVTFAPTAAGSATGTLSVNSSAAGSPLTVALSGTGVATTTTNLALNKPVTASSHAQVYVPANVTDGNTSTYWEANNAAWPSTITVNLGSAQTLGSVTVDLPPSAAWSTRTQTLSVLGSTNGTTFSTLVASATYTWNPSTGNTVTIPLPSGTSDQYLQLSYTANNVQNGAQASEIQIFG